VTSQKRSPEGAELFYLAEDPRSNKEVSRPKFYPGSRNEYQKIFRERIFLIV
jgi:hypothetical protein